MTAKTCFSAFTKRIVSDQFGSNLMNELHLSPISGKSLLYISYHADQQHEVKLLKQSLDLAGFDCVGDWILAGKTGQELNEKRRNLIAGSSLFLAFITPQ